jgi:hypothetical protein
MDRRDAIVNVERLETELGRKHREWFFMVILLVLCIDFVSVHTIEYIE